MGTPYVAGPSQWFVNTGADNAWQYLGMCEGDTGLDLSPEWEGIRIDGSVGGDYDRQLMTVAAGVSGDLAYWNEPVLDKLKNFVNVSTSVPGTYPSGTFGSLLRTEGKQFGLIITSQYATKTAYAEAGAHPLWYFPLAFPLPMRRNLSSRATRERVAFDCLVQSDGLGGGVLYFNSITFNLPVPT